MPSAPLLQYINDRVRNVGYSHFPTLRLANFARKFIVADAKLLTIFKNTNTTSKTGKVTDLRNLKEGETINMMQMASVVGANIE